MVEKGKAVMVDVRATWNYEKEHIIGAVNMPLFRGVEGKTPWDTAKRLVMTIGFAMKATGAHHCCWHPDHAVHQQVLQPGTNGVCVSSGFTADGISCMHNPQTPHSSMVGRPSSCLASHS